MIGLVGAMKEILSETGNQYRNLFIYFPKRLYMHHRIIIIIIIISNRLINESIVKPNVST